MGHAMQALDNYYLAITLLPSIALQALIFVVAFNLGNDRLTDLAGASK